MSVFFTPAVIETLRTPTELELQAILFHVPLLIAIGWLLAAIRQNKAEIHLLEQSRAMLRELRITHAQLDVAHEMADERGYGSQFENRLEAERESLGSMLDRTEELIAMGIEADMDEDEIRGMLEADPEIGERLERYDEDGVLGLHSR